MARYLLTISDKYYPRPKSDDWHSTYETPEQANDAARALAASDEYCMPIFDVIDLLDWLNAPAGKR